MKNKSAGWRVIREANTKYEMDLIKRDVYETQVKWGIHLISIDDIDEAERVARSHGYTLAEVNKKYDL